MKWVGNSPLRAILLFNGLYVAVAVVAALRTGNREFVFYIVMMGVMAAAVFHVHRRVQLSMGIFWALSVWGLAHMVGGLLPVPDGWPYEGTHAVYYSAWLIPGLLKFDQLVHAYGFGVTTWLCFHALRTMAKVAPTFGVLVLCAAAGMGFGALNEVIEFAAVLMIPNTNVGGYMNTGWDLVSNLVGTLIAAIGIRWRYSPNQTKDASVD